MIKITKYIAILTAVLIGCKVDLPVSECGLPDGIVYTNEVFPENKVDRKSVSSNPLNMNEFVYTAYTDNQHGIWKYNLATFDTELVLNINADFTPDWSITDWLVFTSQNQIFKCKSNGDSLTQLTFEDRNYHPTWSPDGSQIVFERNGTETVETEVITIDNNGIVLEQLQSTNYAGDAFIWAPDGYKVAFVSFSNIYGEYLLAWYYKSLPEQIFYMNQSVPEYETLSGPLQWSPDSEYIYWDGNRSLYKTSIITGKTSLVKYGCEYDYNDFTLLLDGQTIVSRRQELTFVPSDDEEAASMGFGTIYVDYDLVKLNPDGMEEIIPY